MDIYMDIYIYGYIYMDIYIYGSIYIYVDATMFATGFLRSSFATGGATGRGRRATGRLGGSSQDSYGK